MSTRKIHVIDAKEISSGTGAKGAWTLYEIVATTPEGAPIDLKLKSFEKLDGPVEVEVEKQSHEKYGDSYMLKKAGGGSAGARLGPKVDELRTRVEALEEQAEFIRNQISSINATVVALVERAAPDPSMPAAPAQTGRFGADDDIPF